MPSLYLNTLPGQMPPTPPEYHNFCSDNPLDHHSNFHSTRCNDHPSRHELGRPELQDVAGQFSQYIHAQDVWPSSREISPNAPSNHQGSRQGLPDIYSAIGAPMVPPLRVPAHVSDQQQQHTRSKRAPTMIEAKEEKVMGGVAAHLDYKMEMMVDFVSGTAQDMYDIYASGIFLADIDISRSVFDSKAPVRAEFRKYVSQVLSSTRLPSSTILLGLHYLAVRMTMLSSEGDYKYGGGQLHRMLTVALLLGSKFLDDNTFQNRSWSEVSNIPVGDLNVLEVEWLVAIQWTMHINPQDSNGFLRWHQQWQSFQVAAQAKKTWMENKMESRMEPLLYAMKHTHLDGATVQGQRSSRHYLSPTRLQSALYTPMSINNSLKANSRPPWEASHPGAFPQLRSHVDYSPPSAPETGPNTPNWFGSQDNLGYGREPQQSHPALKMPASLQEISCNALQYDHRLLYAQQFNSHGYGTSCRCSYCSPQRDHFFMASSHGLQPVVG